MPDAPTAPESRRSDPVALGRPARFPGPVGLVPPNSWGVQDLDGLIWEWVEDFTAAALNSACGPSALGDAKNVAPALARLRFRAALTARTTRADLGFRCASPLGGLPARATEASLYGLGGRLLDQTGAPITPGVFRGHPVVISMFYTTCVGMCPLLISDLQRVERGLDPKTRADTRFLLVSFDPDRDTPAALRGTMQRHGLDGARWRLAAAPTPDAVLLAAGLDIKFRKLPDGVFTHTAVLVVLDRQGRPVVRAEGSNPDVNPVIKALRTIRKDR